MFHVKQFRKITAKNMITITEQEYIALLEFKLIALQYAQEEDSSWNYGIKELEQQIEQLKHQL